MTATAPEHTLSVVPARRWQRMAGPALVIGGLGLATVALHVRDPHESGSWGLCPTAAMGFYCPGCGGLRAVNDLTNGDLLGAASSNLALLVAVPFVAVGLALWTLGRWRGRPHYLSTRVARPVSYVALSLLLVFTVLRNLPAGGWLAP